MTCDSMDIIDGILHRDVEAGRDGVVQPAAKARPIYRIVIVCVAPRAPLAPLVDSERRKELGRH